MKTIKALAAITASVAMCHTPQIIAWDFNTVISTDNTSLIISGDFGQQPRFTHYGPKIDAPNADNIHSMWAGMNRPLYPVFGSNPLTLSSLQMVHADGNPTTTLVAESIDTTPTQQGSLTTLTLKDTCYPITVKLCYNAITEADIIEQWVEITNTEKKTCGAQTHGFRVPSCAPRRCMGHPLPWVVGF